MNYALVYCPILQVHYESYYNGMLILLRDCAKYMGFRIKESYYNKDERAFKYDRGTDIRCNIKDYAGYEKMLPPLIANPFHFFYKTPKNIIPATYFISVFEWKLWIVICIFILTWSVLLYFRIFYLNKQSFEVYLETIFEIFEISSNSNESNQYSTIILKHSIQILFFIISSIFSSFLIAQLSASALNEPLKSIDDMVNYPEYKICMFEDGYLYSLLKHFKILDNKFDMDCGRKYNNTVAFLTIVCNEPERIFITTETYLNKIRNRNRKSM